ncbi:outer membrane beta-barrel protein [Arenicella xantha]|uniref:Outer membrane protein with beta-barrel domain n=1 Tax=Arenicella xantha TaxID=644221 RepID=A0A395JPG6_9GAMM|nr:outer membrane beta-barrel protein [Arenicella xantha]RBP50600.1 outer membrane protein with beta-barrel domain [Arenicella xantha]
MNLKTKYLIPLSLKLFFLSVISQPALAENNAKLESRHSLEINLLAGELDSDLAQLGFNDEDTKHYSLSYNYKFDSGFYTGIGYLDGESGSLSLVDDLFGEDELVYDAIYVKGGYQYLLSQRQAFFADVSVLRYDVNLLLNGESSISENGTGLGLTVGWRYQPGNRIGFQVAIDNIQLNSDFDILSVGGGLSYSF